MSDLIDEVRTIRRMPPPALRRAIREAAGISQRRVAAELGVDRPTVTRWEAGLREPQGDLAVRYVQLLDALREVTS